jgi:hypothetical protein
MHATRLLVFWLTPCRTIEAIFRTNINCNFSNLLHYYFFVLCCPKVLDRAPEGAPLDLVLGACLWWATTASPTRSPCWDVSRPTAGSSLGLQNSPSFYCLLAILYKNIIFLLWILHLNKFILNLFNSAYLNYMHAPYYH